MIYVFRLCQYMRQRFDVSMQCLPLRTLVQLPMQWLCGGSGFSPQGSGWFLETHEAKGLMSGLYVAVD